MSLLLHDPVFHRVLGFYKVSCFTANVHIKLAAIVLVCFRIGHVPPPPLITSSLSLDTGGLSPQRSYHRTTDLFSYRWLSKARGPPYSDLTLILSCSQVSMTFGTINHSVLYPWLSGSRRMLFQRLSCALQAGRVK